MDTLIKLLKSIKSFPWYYQILILISIVIILYFSSCKSFHTVNDTTLKADSVYIHHIDYNSQKHIITEK